MNHMFTETTGSGCTESLMVTMGQFPSVHAEEKKKKKLICS